MSVIEGNIAIGGNMDEPPLKEPEQKKTISDNPNESNTRRQPDMGLYQYCLIAVEFVLSFAAGCASIWEG